MLEEVESSEVQSSDKNQKEKKGLHISTTMSHAMQQVVFLISSTSPGRQDRIK
jgi:hypothetical protein